MYVNVDCIGIESVARMIEQANLKRFIVYRQGAQKGSTPVYDCSHTNTNQAALKCFRDWAGNVIMYNANTGMCYDILLFNIDTDEADERKSNKIRFSFALNNALQTVPGGNQVPQAPFSGIDVQKEIDKGIESYMLRHEIKMLKEQIKEYEEAEEDDDEPDVFDKIAGIVSAIKGEQIPAATTINGDNSLDEEAIVEEKMKQKFTPEEIAKKQQNQREALKILWGKNKNLDQDLLRLAKMATDNPTMFKMIILKLRDMVKL